MFNYDVLATMTPK
jgi:hypothetical protein